MQIVICTIFKNGVKELSRSLNKCSLACYSNNQYLPYMQLERLSTRNARLLQSGYDIISDYKAQVRWKSQLGANPCYL